MKVGVFENRIPLKLVLGDVSVLHNLLLSMNRLNQTGTAVFTLLLHILLSVDLCTRI